MYISNRSIQHFILFTFDPLCGSPFIFRLRSCYLCNEVKRSSEPMHFPLHFECNNSFTGRYRYPGAFFSYQTISSSIRCRRMNRFSRLCSITGNRRSSLPSGRSYELVFPFRKVSFKFKSSRPYNGESPQVHFHSQRRRQIRRIPSPYMQKVLKSFFIHNRLSLENALSRDGICSL